MLRLDDSAHSEYFEMTRQLHFFLLDAILTISVIKVYVAMLRIFFFFRLCSISIIYLLFEKLQSFRLRSLIYHNIETFKMLISRYTYSVILLKELEIYNFCIWRFFDHHCSNFCYDDQKQSCINVRFFIRKRSKWFDKYCKKCSKTLSIFIRSIDESV